MKSCIEGKPKSKKIWLAFFYGGKTVFLGLKILMHVLRPSDQSSICSYCGSSLGEESRDVTTFNHQSAQTFFFTIQPTPHSQKLIKNIDNMSQDSSVS